MIVETEAYLGVEDRAAHTFGGRRTPRNESMYRDGGTAYVYAIYGLHFCLNVVAGAPDHPVAALVRALRPVEGLELMRAHRGVQRDTDLCSGPGKLCAAFGIDRALDGVDLVAGDSLWVETGPGGPDVAVGPRVGVDYAGEWAARPLRFAVRGDPNVSRPRPPGWAPG